MTIEDYDYEDWTLANFKNAFECAKTQMNGVTKVGVLRRLAYKLRKQSWAPGYAEQAEILARQISAEADREAG